MKKTLIATGLIAMLTAGCTYTAAQPAADAPVGTNRPTAPAPAPGPNGEASSSVPAPAPVDDGTAPFGTAYAWEDGLSLTVGAPAPYKPGKYAFTGDTFEHFVVFDVRVVNNTGAAWDPVLLHATIQSSNQEGERVFDSGNLPPEPSTKLLDGREVTFKMAFGVADPDDLVLEVAPDWEHESVLFHG